MDVSQWGPWAAAAALVIATVPTLIRAIGELKGGNERSPLHELARAIDKLTAVLERMEMTQGKALDQIQDLLHEQAKTLQILDYRTKEIRDRLFHDST